MEMHVRYAITVNKSYPIANVIGKFAGTNSQKATIREYLQAALIVIDKVEQYNGILLENPRRPENGEKCVYFSVGFYSFEELAQFLNSMNYL